MKTDIPYGYCHCGCGNKTTIISMTATAKGRIKGQPNKYLPGHNIKPSNFWIQREKDLRRRLSTEVGIPYGYCHCGCGEKTKIAPKTSKHYGWVAGEPRLYIHNHFWRGREHKESTKKKMSVWQKGAERTPEQIERLRKINVGRKASDETRRKLSESHRGEKCHLWRGGTSNDPYDSNFTNKLKEQIRDRDGRVCQICNKPEEEDLKSLHVHHIDYNRQNSVPENLIALCHSCHTRTTHEDRFGWELFLGERIMALYGEVSITA